MVTRRRKSTSCTSCLSLQHFVFLRVFWNKKAKTKQTCNNSPGIPDSKVFVEPLNRNCSLQLCNSSCAM